jgi:cystathionine beta-lyase/cystathionine gamma-synthase
VIGGAIITKNDTLHERLCWLQGSVGAILSPDECYRVIQELKTLELRWDRVSQSAQAIAQYLDGQRHIAKTYYPGLPDHPGREVALRQMRHGFGGTVSFDLGTQDLERIGQFVDRLQESGLVVFGESLASPETILAHPATMSHRGLTQAQRDERGIDNSFFRLSIGFEDPADIRAAFDDAFKVFETAVRLVDVAAAKAEI